MIGRASAINSDARESRNEASCAISRLRSGAASARQLSRRTLRSSLLRDFACVKAKARPATTTGIKTAPTACNTSVQAGPATATIAISSGLGGLRATG
jgi:hypothetical protein